VNALVDGKPGDFTQLVVAVGTDGADAVGAEGDGFWFAFVFLKEFFLAFHGLRVLSYGSVRCALLLVAGNG
jgi:hypothetical protein